MKIRLGFVSNSSSSSFVIVMTKEAFNNAMKKAHPFVKAVVKNMDCSKGKLGKQDVITIGTFSDAGDSSTFNEFELDYNKKIPDKYYDEDYIDYNSAFNDFLKLIPVSECITHSEDW